jgi:outer membrane protein assembly factor BamE (lipoprotein component of BamABCDE complex)
MNRRQIALAARGAVARRAVRESLVLLTTALVSACVILPVPTPPIGAKVISDEAQESIKSGTTTRADVLLTLGNPDERQDDDRFFAYKWQVSYASVAVGVAYLGVVGGPMWWYRCLGIEFDPAGTVARTAQVNLGSEVSGRKASCFAEWRKQDETSNESK